MKKKNNSKLYGLLAGIGILVFYLAVVSFFQGIEFAFINLRSLWYLIFPLAAGFGIQIGLFFSIVHSAGVTATVGTTGAISGGSMLACCSHFLLNMLPFVGVAGIATFLVSYQSWFLGIGILSNIIGIGFMINHKKKMEKEMKGGLCCSKDG
jgi:P-type Cu+ transporter